MSFCVSFIFLLRLLSFPSFLPPTCFPRLSLSLLSFSLFFIHFFLLLLLPRTWVVQLKAELRDQRCVALVRQQQDIAAQVHEAGHGRSIG